MCNRGLSIHLCQQVFHSLSLPSSSPNLYLTHSYSFYSLSPLSLSFSVCACSILCGSLMLSCCLNCELLTHIFSQCSECPRDALFRESQAQAPVGLPPSTSCVLSQCYVMTKVTDTGLRTVHYSCPKWDYSDADELYNTEE